MTLIELLISLAVFGILAGMFAWNFDRFRQNDNVQRDAEQLMADLRQAQNMAMTGQRVEGFVPIGGYGLHMNLDASETTYQLFADRERYVVPASCESNRNERYDPGGILSGGAALPDCLTSGTNDDLAVGPAVTLSKDVYIESVLVGAGETSEQVVDIAFQPPKPIPWVGTGFLTNEASTATVKINLCHHITNICRRITVIGVTGQISESTP